MRASHAIARILTVCLTHLSGANFGAAMATIGDCKWCAWLGGGGGGGGREKSAPPHSTPLTPSHLPTPTHLPAPTLSNPNLTTPHLSGDSNGVNDLVVSAPGWDSGTLFFMFMEVDAVP